MANAFANAIRDFGRWYFEKVDHNTKYENRYLARNSVRGEKYVAHCNIIRIRRFDCNTNNFSGTEIMISVTIVIC